MKTVFDYKNLVTCEEDSKHKDIKKEVVESKKFEGKKLHYYSHQRERFSYEFMLVHEAKMQYEIISNEVSKRTLYALTKQLASLGYTKYEKGETK